jgi:hypothetical protein
VTDQRDEDKQGRIEQRVVDQEADAKGTNRVAQRVLMERFWATSIALDESD